MAYGLRYTISQILRNENTQTIDIYEQDYTAGVVKTYIPTSIILQPNSSEEYPYPSIISTQLTFSIILETQDDYDQFPDVLSKNNRKYWVVYREGSDVIWRGFLFNDYAQIGFSTGINEASLVCIDGISFMQDQEYQFEVTESINTRQQWLDIICTTLKFLGYPDDLYLVIACSFYAEGMLDRADGSSNEPFAQTYQYKRDFVGVSYYNIIVNMLNTYNCRMYQANGDWWIASNMEVAAPTRYYTKYDVGVTTTIHSSGVLNNVIDIEPYADGNVHFIDNTQTKILRKGFYNIQLRNPYVSPINLIHNADLKSTTGTFPNFGAYGWFTTLTGTAQAYVIEYPDEQFNSYYLSAGNGDAYLQILAPGPVFYNYTPYVGGVPLKLSIEHKNSGAMKIQIALLDTGSGNKYLQNNGLWTNIASTYIDFPAWDGKSDWSTFNLTIPPFLTSPFSSAFLNGYLNVKILVPDNSTELRNFILKQDAEVQYAVISSDSTEEKSTQKVFEIPYGQIYPAPTGLQILSLGSIYNSSGVLLKNWYFEYLDIDRTEITNFIAYQYIKIYQRNIATLEGDLGAIQADNGYINLDKVYTVADASTGNLSYNGKQFVINRLSTNSYYNEVNGIQLMEIFYDEEAVSTSIQYITNTGQLGPFWNLQLNIF
jgi:hypothetical protein